MPAPLKLAVKEALFKRKRLTLLEPAHGDSKTKLRFRCDVCGYAGSTHYNNLQSGRGCRNCGRHARAASNTMKFQAVVASFEKLGLKLLSDNYSSTWDKLTYQCNTCGFVGQATTNSIRQGQGCRQCARESGTTLQRNSKEKIKASLLALNFRLLDGEYKAANAPLHVQCSLCTTESWIAYSKIQNQLCPCPVCRKSWKRAPRSRSERSFKRLKGIFETLGLEIQEVQYLGYIKPHAYQCSSCGFNGTKTPKEAFCNKTGCRMCSRTLAASKRKYGLKKISEICKRLNITLVDVPKVVSQKIRVIFNECGHEQLKSLEVLQQGKSGCSICSGKARKTHLDYEAVAERYKGSLITQATSARRKSRWCCRLGHTFERSLTNIGITDTFCTVCNQNSMAERLAHTALKHLFGRDFIKIRIPHSKSIRGRTLELDLYNADLKLAIELHGAQHFAPVDFKGEGVAQARQNFEILQENDLRTEQACCQNGIVLIAVRELGNLTSLEEFRTVVGNKCIASRISLPPTFWTIPLKSIQPMSVEGQYWDRVVKKASALGLVPESVYYTRSTDSHWWICSKGHRVQMLPRNIATDRVKSCPKCWKARLNKPVALSDGRIFESGVAAAKALGLHRLAVNAAVQNNRPILGLSVRRISAVEFERFSAQKKP